MNEELFKFIVSRIIDNAQDVQSEYKNDQNDFNAGKKLAYYEVLDVIFNEADAHNIDISDLGIDVDNFA